MTGDIVQMGAYIGAGLACTGQTSTDVSAHLYDIASHFISPYDELAKLSLFAGRNRP